MKTDIISNSIISLIITVFLFSCKSSFPPAGTQINCNGQMITPILNPTQKPEFPNGSQAMHQYFLENLKTPQNLLTNTRGKIRAAFVVNKEGEICNIRITSKPRPDLDTEVIRVLKSMPKWKPGKDQGFIVDSYVLLDFDLN